MSRATRSVRCFLVTGYGLYAWPRWNVVQERWLSNFGATPIEENCLYRYIDEIVDERPRVVCITL